MLKLYKYMYYRLYAWNLRTWGESDGPHFNALFGVSFMMFVNLFIIVGIFSIIGINTTTGTAPRVGAVISLTALVAVNYFWLVHKGKYIQIAKDYEGEPKKKGLRNAVLLWLYVVLSFVIPISLAIVSGRLYEFR